MVACQEMVAKDPFATSIILVVDDDPDISLMLKNILEDFGSYQVILAANGFHAFDLLRSVQPDLFLFDYLLPGIDGLELYQRLHAERAFATIPVLFLSANAPKEAFEKQHLFYLSKPFEVEDLLQKVDMLLTG